MNRLYDKSSRRFFRRLRASDMYKFLRSGCEMGWYGHFTKPVPTPGIDDVLRKILKDMEKRYDKLR